MRVQPGHFPSLHKQIRRHSTLLFSIAAAFCLFLPAATAQADKGSINGRVVDTAGGVLQGAEVDLLNNGATTKTDRQGQFSFVNLDPGSYTVSISFLGLAPYSGNVTVTAAAAARLDATLQVNTQKEEINVTADRPHGEAEAINRQRTADNILQVLPYEVIQSLPNANVADALGRLPSVTLERDEGEGKYVQIRGTEPRFSNVTIDGVNVPPPESGVRQVKLDVIPSDLVESVEINKTLMANMDGDAIGGSINLRTKSAGEQPSISLFGIGGGTPIFNGRPATQFGATVGQRFGRNKRLGILFGGTYDWNGRGINDIEPSPTAIQCDPGNCNSKTVSANAPYYPTYSSIDLRDYRYYRARYGFSGTVDYKFSDASSIYVRGLYSHFNNFGDRWVYSPSINTDSNTSPLQGGTDGSIASNTQIRRPVEVIGSLAAGGRHLFGSSSFTWEVSGSRSASEDQGYSSAYFGPVDSTSPLNNIQYALNLSNPYRPKFIVQNGVNIYDPSLYLLQGTNNFDVSHSYSPQLNLQAGAAYSKTYQWGHHLGTFDIGGKFRNEHKFEESNDTTYFVNQALPMSNFLSTLTDKNYYDKSYAEGPFVDYTKFRNFFNANQTNGVFTVDANNTHLNNDPNNFNLVERVSAGYAMNIIDFGKFRLYTGLRFEVTNLNVTGYNVTIDSDGNYASTVPLRQNASYVSPLPSAELTYNLTQNSRFRLAYGRGIARPNFGDLPPYFTRDISKQQISIGNPNLKPTHANNYDLLFEQYLKPLGLIQAGFFYKDITDPIYSVGNTLTTGPYAGYLQYQPINGSSASLWGFEIAYQQRLSFLPGVLSAAGISANYSWTTSQANGVPGRSDHPALQRQAPNTWNVSPTYDKGRASVRVGISYNGANIFNYNYQDGAPLGIKGPNGDNYLYAHLQLDAQGSIRLGKGLSAVIYGLNLNNEVFGFYYGSTIYPNQREYYKPTYGAGLRWNSIGGR